MGLPFTGLLHGNSVGMDTDSCAPGVAIENAEIHRYAALATLPPEQMLTIKALAACLGCSTRTIYRMVKRFELPPPAVIGNKSIWTVRRIRDRIDRLCGAAGKTAAREAARLRNFEFRT